MTFDEWFKDNFLFGKLEDYKLTELESIIKENCRQSWNAAKEDSKQTVRVSFGHRFDEWVVTDCEGKELKDSFISRSQGMKWAIDNGYRIKDS